MPVVLYFFAIVLFFWSVKKRSKPERLFLGFGSVIFPVSYILCRIIASANQHFWDNRYVFAALGIFWLFIIVLYMQKGRLIFCLTCIFAIITVLSAYRIEWGREIGTNGYLNDTYQVLAQTGEERVMLFNYTSYDVLYEAHLPGVKFYDIDEFEWESFENEYVYFICWGGRWFSEEISERYIQSIYNCGTMRFEEGVAGVTLFKIYLKQYNMA